MRQQQTLRGFIFVLLVLILITIVVRFPYARQADKVTNQDFIKILEDGQAADMSIHQNPRTLTGEVVLTLLDGQVKRLYVSDVKDVQKFLGAYDMVYMTMDVPRENHLVTIVLPFMLPIVVMVIIIMVTNRSVGGGGTSARMINSGKSKARMSRDSKVNLSDVADFVEEKKELEEVVGLLKNPQRYTSMGVRVLKGFLLMGPPGTGRTLSAKTVVGGAEVPFFPISGSDFVEMFVDVGASRARDLFGEAKGNSPYIVFIDRIDAVACHRGTGAGGGHDERGQALNQPLAEMNGFGTNEGIIVVTATNRVDILDPIILRPGRFDRKVAVGRPDVKGREKILKVHSREKPLDEDVDLRRVVQTTSDLMGADLENLTNEVAIISARENRRFIKQSGIDRAFVKMEIDAEERSKVISEKDKKITACHETGHAILSHVLPDVGLVHIMSIVPTGVEAAGYTMPLPEKDEMFGTKGHMKQNIMVNLNSWIAEELIFGDITTGASRDIKQATQIAGVIVTQYGMSGKIGMIQYGDDENGVFIGRNLTHIKSYGNEATGTTDSEVKRVVNGHYQKAKDIVKQYNYVLHACADLSTGKEKASQSKSEALFTPAQ